MSNKNYVPLNEFVLLQRGFDLPQSDRICGDIPVVASTGVAGFHNEYKVDAPGVVIGRSGSIGGGQYITKKFWPLNTTLWVKDFKGHDARYVYYLLKSIDFQRFNVGTGVPTLNRNHLSSVLVKNLGYKNEKLIAKILGDLDDKIHLNNQLNKTLESIAQALFKSWFIDFDPVRAKIEARQEGKDPVLAAMCVISGKSEAELRQMAKEDFAELQATAALFPDELVESELGEVPKGWELQQFKDIAKYTSNKISLNDLTLENYISTENMLSEKKGIEKASSLPKVNSVPAFKKGNILVSNIRPYFKKIWFSSFEGGHSNDVLNFEVLEEGCEEYLYNLIYQDSFFDQMMASSKGSKMPRGDKKAIMNFQVVIPSITLRRLYSRKVRKFYLKQNIIEKENQALKIIRDTLCTRQK
ncbi:restriction endonuclease subunit S [Acinetobacter towneri]|uniref:restriction endonuclease subunit S n=1 Tax=Acinetobacter towneri TaxID=202956 RepID=UPI002935F4E5|nr:restriction endonuclease subunit S [Acinetobacter towneri]MDV2485494.1 restriction endonuclease subunit S [Acinetobacter towneri]